MHRIIISGAAALLILVLTPVEASGDKNPRGKTGKRPDARSKVRPRPAIPKGSAVGPVYPSSRPSKSPQKDASRNKKGCKRGCKENVKPGAVGAKKPSPGRRLSARDQEVVKNIELLEELELLRMLEIFIEVKRKSR